MPTIPSQSCLAPAGLNAANTFVPLSPSPSFADTTGPTRRGTRRLSKQPSSKATPTNQCGYFCQPIPSLLWMNPPPHFYCAKDMTLDIGRTTAW